MPEANRSGIDAFKKNIKTIKQSFVRSFLRGGRPSSDRSRAAVMVNNFFLHIQGVRTHLNTLRPAYTLGLGLIAFYLLIITFISGALLMIYYHPSVENAYSSVKDISYVVYSGRLMRNIHKWAGEAMIIFVILHMARVFYTSSYKKGREFNWLIGIALLVLTFALNLSGYLLTWDQLAYWAFVIVANIVQSPKEITDIFGVTGFFDVGGASKEIFLGGSIPGQESLVRVYLLHIVLLPLIISILLGVHFWRVRKDGGLTRPDGFESEDEAIGDRRLPEKKEGQFSTHKTYGLMALPHGKTPAVDQDVENTVMSWPHLLRAEAAVFIFCLAAVVVYAFHVNAPLRELANPLIPENPAKAPWYFLGLQELVSYSAFMGGIALPGLALLGLALIPYLDRERDYVGIWFSNRQGWFVALKSFVVGTAVVIGLLAIVINYGWLRTWWPEVPQLLIILVNPGTIWVGFMMAWSVWTIKKTDSTRMGAIAVFTMFLLSYVIFTYFGTELRGPDWEFYWSKSQWPIH